MRLACGVNSNAVVSSANTGVISVTFSTPVTSSGVTNCLIGIAVPAPYTTAQVTCSGTIPGVGSQVSESHLNNISILLGSYF